MFQRDAQHWYEKWSSPISYATETSLGKSLGNEGDPSFYNPNKLRKHRQVVWRSQGTYAPANDQQTCAAETQVYQQELNQKTSTSTATWSTSFRRRCKQIRTCDTDHDEPKQTNRNRRTETDERTQTNRIFDEPKPTNRISDDHKLAYMNVNEQITDSSASANDIHVLCFMILAKRCEHQNDKQTHRSMINYPGAP